MSGLSSGAYFAVQFHVSFSKTIMGAGVVAGGIVLESKHHNMFVWGLIAHAHIVQSSNTRKRRYLWSSKPNKKKLDLPQHLERRIRPFHDLPLNNTGTRTLSTVFHKDSSFFISCIHNKSTDVGKHPYLS